ncbi:MAG TPA: NAD(P)/FAD-dependent oxidoreductase [Candidatus Deferrimicrobium sp.]|nr:NAD(P)/FAD-dependent oxidoreductase [Candidatus Deferrimicrobium sp.]
MGVRGRFIKIGISQSIVDPLKNEFDLIIIGAGPAGLFTAANIKKKQSVLVLEKNENPGKKLLISGSGRCNITHAGDIDEFFNHYGDNSRFLKTALRQFSNDDLINFFREKGLGTVIDTNGKVFPRSGNARDVLAVLLNECKRNKVEINYNEAVLKIKINEKGFDVTTKNNEYVCSKLLIATGGKSYPASGSSGDGYILAEGLGHTVVSPQPALTPAFIKNYKFSEISGVSLRERTIYLYRDHKKVKAHCGDFGFTHTGLSGPGILDFSRDMKKNDILKIDFVNRKAEDFARALSEAIERDGKITVGKFLKGYDIPVSLVRIILAELGLDRNEKLANINKKMRNRIVDSFCEYPFVIERMGGFDMAMVTKGGIALNEVSAKTMESKLIKGLYFAGEVLDIDGDTGGYNIQAAFSTGYLAAVSIGP